MNIYTIIAYVKKIRNPKSDLMDDFIFLRSVEVEVEAENEGIALLKARRMIKRKGYYTKRVIEKDTFHDEIHVMQLEMQKQMLDVMKGRS